MTNAADVEKKAALKAAMRDMIAKKKEQIAETKKADAEKKTAESQRADVEKKVETKPKDGGAKKVGKEKAQAAMREALANRKSQRAEKAVETKKAEEVVEVEEVVTKATSPMKENSTQKKVDKLYKDWDKIVEDELGEDDDDDDFDSGQLEELNKVYMAAEKDFYKEMSNFDKIEQEDGWNDLVSQDKESAESFKHPHKPRLSETLPDRTVTGHANPQKAQQQAIIKKQDAAYKNFCKGFLKGAEPPKPRKNVPKKVVEAEKDDANLDKLMAALDEMGKVKEEDDNLLKSLRERFGDPLEDARARAAGPEQLTDEDIQKMMAEVCGRSSERIEDRITEALD